MKLFFIMILLHPLICLAQVWNSKNKWNQSYENEFRIWVQSIDKDIVITPESPYFGLGVDCADMVYLLKIIFAHKNNLEYITIDPRTNKKISNNTKKFNNLEKKDRLKAFLNYIFKRTSTVSLRDLHSYPIKIKEIKAGDIFHFEKIKNGNKVRHVVLILKVLENGNFDYIYSTQATKENNLRHFKDSSYKPRGFTVKRNRSFKQIPNQFSGGFRRLKFPHLLHLEDSVLPFYSLEQYNMGDDFFKKVKKTLQTKKENSSDILISKLKNICQSLKERGDIVLEGVEFFQKKRKCLDYQEYDTFSTPVRDSSIRKEIEELASLMTINEIPDDFCPIKIEDQNFSAKKLLNLFLLNKVSGDPHQSVKARWGLSDLIDNSCRAFY